MRRRIRRGIIERQVFDLFGEHLDVLFQVSDSVVLSATGFRLPGDDFLPQTHHLIAHLLDEILVLLSVRGKEGFRHGLFDLSLD